MSNGTALNERRHTVSRKMSPVGKRKTYSYVTYPTALEYYGSRELRPQFDCYWALKTVPNLIKNGNLPVCSVTLLKEDDDESTDETTGVGEFNASTLEPLMQSIQDTKTAAVVFVSNATSYRWVTQCVSGEEGIRDDDGDRVGTLPPKTRFLAVRMPVQMFLSVPIDVLFGGRLREITTLSLYDACGSRPRHDAWVTSGESNWDWICANVLRKLSMASPRKYKLLKKLDLTDAATVCMDVFLRNGPSKHEWAIFPVIKILDSAGTLKVARLRHKREDLTVIIRAGRGGGGGGDNIAGNTNGQQQLEYSEPRRGGICVVL